MKVKVPMKRFLLNGQTTGFRQHMNDKLERFRVTFTANGKRQTWDSCWEILKRNERLKAAQNNTYGYNWRESTDFHVVIMSSERQHGK